MNCAGASLALPGSVQAMPMTSDQYTLLAWTQVPHREFPSCNKGEHGHKCLIENSRFVTKVIFADKDKSRSCSEKTPWTREKDSPEGSGYETIPRLQKYCSQPPWVQHTHSSLPFSRRKPPKREQQPRDPTPLSCRSRSQNSVKHGGRFWKTLQDRIL